jgi:hypothetical protein
VKVLDFDGTCQLTEDEELLSRLRSVRRGADGAFILSHGGPTSLWLHFNGEASYLYFFPDQDGTRAGYVPDGMWPGDHDPVSFQLVGGSEADSITVPGWQLVPVDVAYRAAVEYLHTDSLPRSIKWLEL